MTRLIASFLLILLASCGARQETADSFDKALNVTTEVVDPLYGALVISCDATEGLIIARHEASEADEAEAKLFRLRGTCDGIIASLEALRALQETAREAVDAYRAGSIEISDVLQALGPVSELVQQIKAAVAAFRETWGDSSLEEPEAPPPVSENALPEWHQYLHPGSIS